MALSLLCLLFTTRILSTYSSLCNVLDYGAKGDGITLDTQIIQSVLDDKNCSITYLPSNYIFLTYPLVINKNGTNLWIDTNTTLLYSANITGWPVGGHYHHCISAINISNIAVYGNGIIDANSPKSWYPLYLNRSNGTLHHGRPYLMNFDGCDNITLFNLTLLNAPSYNVWTRGDCDGLTVYNLNITSPGSLAAPNTDGIDIACNNVHIYNSFIKNGDDSYCLKSGARNVLIENCTATQGFGLVSGTGATPPIYNATFRNCTVYDAEWGIKVKAEGDKQNGTMSDITFEDITLRNVYIPIYINQVNSHPCGGVNHSATHSPIKQTDDKGVGNILFKDITFRNIKGTYDNCAGTLICTEGTPCDGILFEDVDLTSNNKSALDWFCGGYVNGSQSNVTPKINCPGF